MNANKKYNRRTYKETDDYRVWLEEMEGQPVVHVVIYNMDRAIFEEIKEVWADIAIDAYFEGYDQLFTYTKDSRIVDMIGGAEKVGEHQGYEVYKWELS